MANGVLFESKDQESTLPLHTHDGSTRRPISLPMPSIHTTFWLLTATISLLTTKRLLEHDFHFPMHLLCLQLMGASGVRLIQWTYNRIQHRQSTVDAPKHSNSSRLPHLVVAICVSMSLLFAYQALHHWYNLPVVVMVLGLDWQIIPETTSSTPAHLRLKNFILRALLLVGIALVLLCDFRLTQQSLTLLLLSLVFSQLARLMLAHTNNGGEQVSWPKWSSKMDYGRPTSSNSSTIFLCAILSAMVWCYFREQQFTSAQVLTYHPWSTDRFALVLNIVTSSIALNSPGYLFRRCAGGWDDAEAEDKDELSANRATMSTALVFLVAAGRTHWWTSPSSNLHPLQWIGFLLASFACLMINVHDDASTVELRSSDSLETPTEYKEDLFGNKRSPDGSQGHIDESQSPRPLWASLAIGAIAALPLTALLYLVFAAHVALSQSSHAVVDQSWNTPTGFDIVIARYQESASEIATHLVKVLDLPNIRSTNVSIRVYNKGGDADDSSALKVELQSLLSDAAFSPDITTESLPNVGREADTYLHHITTQWDHIANNTLFVQAGVHRPEEYARRIEDYFVPTTGFLALGKSDGYCSSCSGCHDRDWTEEAEVLEQLYGDFNGGAVCKNVVLTYRGQFVVSAARIRSNEKETYLQWLQELREPQSRLHTAPYTQSPTSRKQDMMSAPRVGFTLERTWGVMFQCNEKWIAETCPSLLSGLVRLPLLTGAPVVEDCQCLD